MAAELASALLNETIREDSNGNEFYLTATHKRSEYGIQYADVVCSAAASSGSCASGVNWRFENDTLTLSGSGAVPDYPAGSAPWKAGYTDRITSVVIEDGITSVGASFRDCTNAAEVTLPASAESVSSDAFTGCKKLKLANVVCGTAGLSWAKALGISCLATGTHQADSTAKCGVCGRAFSVSGTGVLALPSSLTQLGAKAFSGSTAKTIVIPESCAAIPEDAFEGCDEVTTLILPKTLKDGIPSDMREQLIDTVLVTY